MACGCGKPKYNMTSAQLEEERRQAEFNARVAAETAASSSGEHEVPSAS